MLVKKKHLSMITNLGNCVGCRLCQMRCSFRWTKQFSFADARINIEWNEEKRNYEISFKDECDFCGACARFCVYGALAYRLEGKNRCLA